MPVSGVSKTTHRLGDLVGGLNETLLLTAVTYYCSRKRHMAQSEETRFVLPVESHRMPLLHPALSYDTMCEILSTREVIRVSA